jgi:hypothetical protein
MTDTKIIANVLNYDDNMAILQQGSIRSIIRFFNKLEYPDIPDLEDGGMALNDDKKDKDAISINSIGFIIKLIIFFLFIMMVRDFL